MDEDSIDTSISRMDYSFDIQPCPDLSRKYDIIAGGDRDATSASELDSCRAAQRISPLYSGTFACNTSSCALLFHLACCYGPPVEPLQSLRKVLKQAGPEEAMTIRTLSVGAAVTPTVVKTYISHVIPCNPESFGVLTNAQYANRKARHQKPTAHISYDEGLHLIRSFLSFASHHTVEELQAFTAQWVPNPHWVKVDNFSIPAEHLTKAADVITEQLGPRGLDKIGGGKWWQWRQKGGELKADWIEMRAHFNERKRFNEKSKRVMLYVHGGAYFFGSVDEHRYQMQRHARKLGARVLAPRYRLAPQFPFPCGLLDCLAAYLYLLTVQDPAEIILAGDSAGGGMIVSILCILRDRGLPLPAGAILISPWVDLTHSFPSLTGDGSFDYIPADGFMQKPSASWPPPNDDEILGIAKAAIPQTAPDLLPGKPNRKEQKSDEIDAVRGFAVAEATANANMEEAARQSSDNLARSDELDAKVRPGNTIPGPGHNLSIEIDGVLVKLKDQIQMYTTNQLISHPLVSPVLQPSLGGLPPLLILTGGGELLRDEQIFLAHKAARPSDPRYQLGDAYKADYDADGKIAEKWRHHPTPVQLQVWDDLCHVAPTLSFTRPAKFMYRSVAQFGAWALARAQGVGVEIVDDDAISIISSGSDTETDGEGEGESTDSLANAKKASSSRVNGSNGTTNGAATTNGTTRTAHVGKAGDPLPPFRNHMIRQRVDRNGVVFPLAPERELDALQMDRNDVGVIKAGTVRKWMAAKAEWDGKYASAKRRVQKQRVKEAASGSSFGQGENPPPTALAGRRAGREAFKKGKKSMGLAMWSLWGSKHDESTLKREKEMEKGVQERNGNEPKRESAGVRAEERVLGRRISGVVGDIPIVNSPDGVVDGTKTHQVRSRSRRRTVTVVDRGQVEGLDSSEHDSAPALVAGMDQDAQSEAETDGVPQQAAVDGGIASNHLSPLFIPKFKSHLSHLRGGSRDGGGDTSSVRTGVSMNTLGEAKGVESDNVSTMAVFAAPGVMLDRTMDRDVEWQRAGGSGLRSETASAYDAGADGADTPGSRRSVERLFSHQVMPEGEEVGDRVARAQAMRSPSSVAVVQAEGVIGVVDNEDQSNGVVELLESEAPGKGKGKMKEVEGPGMYDRADSEFQTAQERL